MCERLCDGILAAKVQQTRKAWTLRHLCQSTWLLQQGNGIPTDHKKAAVLYQKAVDQNHVEAHLSLGMCFLEGRGVEKDTEWAVKLLHVPANKGSAIAQFNLGCLYSRGFGVRKDDHK